MTSPIEMRYERTLDSLIEGFQIIGFDWTYLYVNPAAAAHGRKRVEDLLGRTIQEASPGIEGSAVFGVLERCMKERTRQTIDHEFVYEDGHSQWFQLRIEPVPEGLCVHSIDIQHQHDAQAAHADALEKLRDSEERLRSVLDSAVDAIIVSDSRGRIESFNPAAESLFGYAAADVLGLNLRVLMPEPDASQHDGYMSRYLATGERHIIGIGRDVLAKRRDGTTFPARLSVSEAVIRGNRIFTGIIHDLTGRVRLEERLREQASLVRMGEMAAVLAHEVRNPLAAVRGAIQVIAGRLSADTREASVFADIIARLDSLNALMTDLLMFARPPQPHVGPVAVGTLVRATAALLGQDPACAGVRVDISESSAIVMADAELIKGALLNLLLNAAQAMEGRGAITVTISSTATECTIAIADEGPGIPSEIREHVFTPFFTTKARGTGLGLSTAKRMLEAQGGRIAIECMDRGGTVVIVQLPTGLPEL